MLYIELTYNISRHIYKATTIKIDRQIIVVYIEDFVIITDV